MSTEWFLCGGHWAVLFSPLSLDITTIPISSWEKWGLPQIQELTDKGDGSCWKATSPRHHEFILSSTTPFPGCLRQLGDKESACQCRDTGDVGSIPGSEDSPGGENGNPLQYSCPDNPIDRGIWRATRLQGCKSQTQLNTAHRQVTTTDWWYSGCSILTCRWFPETCDPVPGEHEHQNPRYWTIVSSRGPLISIPSWPTGPRIWTWSAESPLFQVFVSHQEILGRDMCQE